MKLNNTLRSAVLGAMISIPALAHSSWEQLNYQNKPLVFGGQVFSQQESNIVFNAGFQKELGKDAGFVTDSVQVGDQYVALLIQKDQQSSIVFTDGQIYFTSKNTITPLVTPELEDKLMSHYRLNEVLTIPKQNVRAQAQTGNALERAASSAKMLAQAEQVKTPLSNKPLDDFFKSNLDSLTTVQLSEVGEGLPDVVVFVSSQCGYCKKLIQLYQENPELYKGVNLAFIPVGNPESVKSDEWTSFFGKDPGVLTSETLLSNNDFFLKVTELNDEKGFATPSFMWLSKKEGQAVKVNGLIDPTKMAQVTDDALSINESLLSQ